MWYLNVKKICENAVLFQSLRKSSNRACRSASSSSVAPAATAVLFLAAVVDANVPVPIE